MSEKLPLLYRIQAEGGILVAHFGGRMLSRDFLIDTESSAVIVHAEEAAAVWYAARAPFCPEPLLRDIESAVGVGRVQSVSPFCLAAYELPLAFLRGEPDGRALAIVAHSTREEVLERTGYHSGKLIPRVREELGALARDDRVASLSVVRVAVQHSRLIRGVPFVLPMVGLQSYDASGVRAGVVFVPVGANADGTDFLPADLHAIARTCVGIANIACAFMHCRGTPLEQREPDSSRRKWHRRMRVPAVKEYVLRVAGCTPGGRSAVEGESAEPGRALHLCRGHFANYTAEKPLFGKHVGQFWIPQHTRGSATFGEVRKSYKATQPAARG